MTEAKVVVVLCALLAVQAQANVAFSEQQQLTGLLDGLIEIVNAAETVILDYLEAVKLSASDSEGALEHVRNVITSGTRTVLTNLKADLDQDLDKLKNRKIHILAISIATFSS
ncbi:unnamed protein product [Callosobruchus maculatus]|uniref:Uncharacterized protein n=1 Tax=Callosobruchus maculatus TaxID=64391 RepID=A0A653CQB7_CALMS|nr:unnamed protein product [Callosobruchus maculatus]